ncbi:MAG: rod shape-determining protein MreC [Verrucomicrobiota bacterium]
MSRINIVAIILLVVTVIWLLAMGSDTVAGIRQKGLSATAPFGKLRTSFEKTGNRLSGPRKSRDELEAELLALQRQVDEGNINEQVLERIYEENERFRHLLKLQQASRFYLVAAEVVSRETDKWYNTLTISKGALHGISKGDTVIVDRGLVGKISLAAEDYSTVLLLTDEACRVTAVVVGTEERGVIEGRGGFTQEILVAQGEVEGLRGVNSLRPKLRLKHLDHRAKIQPAMQVESSGAGRVFPGGIAIGEVVSVKEEEGNVTKEAIVQPSVDFRNLDFVFVITGAQE